MDTAIIATLAGHSIIVDTATIPAALAGMDPEQLHTHWVEINGVRWPPKQVVEAVTGRPRRDYTSHDALRVLGMAGLPTSSWRGARRNPRTATGAQHSPLVAGTAPQQPPAPVAELFDAVESLAEFLTTQKLTNRLADLEHQMLEAERCEVHAATREAGLDQNALISALKVRRALGRMSDVIHAAAIALTLEKIMVADERLTARPSLGAGNDLSRRYDVETNLRVAEFKLSVWRGGDTMRQRGAAKDLIHLAQDTDHQHRQLFVLGKRPEHYLTTSQSTVGQNLARVSVAQRERFTEHFGAEAMSLPISVFRTTHAMHVEIVDLTQHLPELNDWLELL